MVHDAVKKLGVHFLWDTIVLPPVMSSRADRPMSLMGALVAIINNRIGLIVRSIGALVET